MADTYTERRDALQRAVTAITDNLRTFEQGIDRMKQARANMASVRTAAAAAFQNTQAAVTANPDDAVEAELLAQFQKVAADYTAKISEQDAMIAAAEAARA